MSLPVALQSVLFYVVACTPCAKVRHRNKAKVQAKKERLEKARVEAEQPDLYRHPDPFSTNPYWSEEIMMGPSLPKKGKARNDANKSERGLTSAGVDSGIGTRSSLAISNAGTSASAKDLPMPMPTQPRSQTPLSEPTVVASSSEEPSSPTLTQTASVSTRDDWNLQRYQREDEELWGHELSRTGHKLMDALKQASTSAGRFVEAKLGMEKEKEKQVTDTDRYNFYFTPKNPPVNDYHPPVVSSKPAHRDGHRWMLQPPPSAKVMEGKIPVSRCASMASVSSRRTAATSEGPGLSRLVGERLVEAKIRNGETPDEARPLSTSTLMKPLTRRTTAGSSARSRSQRTVRSRSHSLSTESEPEGITEGNPRKRRKPRVRPSPIPTPQDLSDDDDEWVSRSLESLSKMHVSSHAAQRPRLSTILSSDQTRSEASTTPMPLLDASNYTTATAPHSGSVVKEPATKEPAIEGPLVTQHTVAPSMESALLPQPQTA
jgi:hypothetical protein